MKKCLTKDISGFTKGLGGCKKKLMYRREFKFCMKLRTGGTDRLVGLLCF